jgi:hypothetical protein
LLLNEFIFIIELIIESLLWAEPGPDLQVLSKVTTLFILQSFLSLSKLLALLDIYMFLLPLLEPGIGIVIFFFFFGFLVSSFMGDIITRL